MRQSDRITKKEALRKAHSATQTDPQSTASRRGIIGSLSGSIAAIPLIGGVSADRETSVDQKTAVEYLSVTLGEVMRRFNEVPNSLLDKLQEEGLIKRPIRRSIPNHGMDDEGRRGGFEKVLVNGERENVLVHIETDDGGRLTVQLPSDDRDPSAEYHPSSGERVVHFDASGRRRSQELSATLGTQTSGVGTQASCPDDCTFWCTCATFCDPTTLSIYEPCPNCWLPWENCKKVDDICDGCTCGEGGDSYCEPV